MVDERLNLIVAWWTHLYDEKAKKYLFGPAEGMAEMLEQEHGPCIVKSDIEVVSEDEAFILHAYRVSDKRGRTRILRSARWELEDIDSDAQKRREALKLV